MTPTVMERVSGIKCKLLLIFLDLWFKNSLCVYTLLQNQCVLCVLASSIIGHWPHKYYLPYEFTQVC